MITNGITARRIVYPISITMEKCLAKAACLGNLGRYREVLHEHTTRWWHVGDYPWPMVIISLNTAKHLRWEHLSVALNFLFSLDLEDELITMRPNVLAFTCMTHSYSISGSDTALSISYCIYGNDEGLRLNNDVRFSYLDVKCIIMILFQKWFDITKY